MTALVPTSAVMSGRESGGHFCLKRVRAEKTKKKVELKNEK